MERLRQAIRSNASTLVALAVVCAVLVLAFALRQGGDAQGGLVARVHDGDGQTHELPLSEDARLEVTTSLGTNVIVVADGAAWVAEADCPRGDCLRQQPISQPGQQLICLPHQLWVEVVEPGAADGELDVDAVQAEAGQPGVDVVSR